MDLPLEIEFGRAVKRLFWTMQNKSNHLLKPFGLTNEQWRLLLAINFCEGKDQQFYATETCKVKSAISPQFRKMSQAGLIARVADQNDSRSKLIYLTDKGRTLVQQGLLIIKEYSQNCMSAYPHKEVRKMIDMMNELVEKIENDENI